MRCRLDYRYLIRPREHAPIELLIKRIYKTLAPAASLPVFTQHHLLNPRACSAYLWSEDAARSQDPETQALLLSIPVAACSNRPIQQVKTRLNEVSDPGPAGAPAAAGSIFQARGSAAPHSVVHSVPPSPHATVVAASVFHAHTELGTLWLLTGLFLTRLLLSLPSILRAASSSASSNASWSIRAALRACSWHLTGAATHSRHRMQC